MKRAETLELPNELLMGEVTRLLNEGNSVVIRTKGNSMLPFITGDRDSVELIAPVSLKENDIALAHLKNGMYVLHRIIGLNGNDITLMGDGNIRGTEHCSREDVCGIVTSILKDGGRTVDCSSTPFMRKVRLWCRLLPIRRYLLYIYRKINRIK